MSLAFDIEMLCDVLDSPIGVSTSDGESFVITNVYRVCPIFFLWDFRYEVIW